MTRLTRRTVVAGLATLPAWTRPARSDDAYPQRPVKVIVPFSAGGVTDVAARLWSQRVSERLGKQFVIENQGGGGANIGIGSASRATPDGYTLLMAASAFAINPSLYNKIPYDPNGFEPVTMLGVTPNVLFVNPSIPATTLAEFLKLIQDNPGKYAVASSGIGTPVFLQGELLKFRYKLELTPVPFAGGSQAVQAVVGGHVPVAMTTLTSIPPLVETGKLRALAVTGAERSVLLPKVPTFKELGLADLEAGTWVGLLAPGGTPKPIVTKLYEATKAFLAEDSATDRLRQISVEPKHLTPPQFAEQLKKEAAEWSNIIKLAKLERV